MNNEKSSIVSRNLRRMKNDVYKIRDMVVSCEKLLPPYKFNKLKTEIEVVLKNHEKVSKKIRYRNNVLVRNNSKMVKKIKELEDKL